MKHTDFSDLIQGIKLHERTELQKAIEAHGGSFEWAEEESPIIAVNVSGYNPNPDDIRVIRVAIINGHLQICGVDKEYGNPVDFLVDEVFAGHLSHVTDSIPEINGISDVSLPLNMKRERTTNIKMK